MKYILHPGYCKTATKTLQNNLIERHSQILSLARPWNDKTLNFVREIKKHEALDFNIERAKFALDILLNSSRNSAVLRAGGVRVAVISDETLQYNLASRDGNSKASQPTKPTQVCSALVYRSVRLRQVNTSSCCRGRAISARL